MGGIDTRSKDGNVPISPGEMFWKRKKKQGHIGSYTVLLSNDKIGFCYGLIVDWDGVQLGIQEERRWKMKGQMPLGCFGLLLLFSSPSSQRTLRTYPPHPFRTRSSSLLEQRLWDG